MHGLIFHDTEIKFICQGQRHIGGIIGNDDLKTKYVSEKVINRLDLRDA